MLGYVTVSWLREHIPLKQGLRLPNDQYKIPIPIPQRAYSIKTRIKTKEFLQPVLYLQRAQRAYSIKTRIKTAHFSLLRQPSLVLREHIPLKQGLRRNILHRARCRHINSESIFH